MIQFLIGPFPGMNTVSEVFSFLVLVYTRNKSTTTVISLLLYEISMLIYLHFNLDTLTMLLSYIVIFRDLTL